MLAILNTSPKARTQQQQGCLSQQGRQQQQGHLKKCGIQQQKPARAAPPVIEGMPAAKKHKKHQGIKQ